MHKGEDHEMIDEPKFRERGMAYWGRPKDLGFGLFVHEERQKDGSVKRFPLIPTFVKVDGDKFGEDHEKVMV